MTDAAGFQLFLLGGFELRRAGATVRLAPTAERVLAFLALHDRPATRAYLAGSLWPEVSEARASGNLRNALWNLRRVDPGLVSGYGHHLGLTSSLWSDIGELAGLALRVRARPPDPALLDADISALGRELLPGYWDSWLVIERERLRQVAITTLERLGQLRLEHGRAAEAVLAALAAVGADPLRETSNLLVVRAHLACGNRVEAIRHLARYREALRRELSIEPDPRFTAAVDALGSGLNTTLTLQ